MNLNERISLLRQEKGMTQEQLGNLLDVTSQTVEEWESNESVPDIDYIVKLGDIFDVSLDYLIKGEKGEENNCKVNKTEIKTHKKHGFGCGTALIIIGIVVLNVMPTIASLYQGFIFKTWNNSYEDYKLYLGEWPLLGGMNIGKLFIVTGIISLTYRMISNNIFNLQTKLREVFLDYENNKKN